MRGTGEKPMKSLDYFYEDILKPVIEDLVGFVVDELIDILLTIAYFVTIPLWIVPYAIIRNKRNKRVKNDEK